MKIKTEIINVAKEKIDESKYIYMLCKCGGKAHKALRPTNAGYYSTICPICKTDIGIVVSKKYSFK